MYMKPVQVMFDESLLAELDADVEVRRDGRSAILRRAARAWLQRKRVAEVSRAYKLAYGGDTSIASELEDWDEQGTWPDA